MKPKGALYLFPKLDPNLYPVQDDEKLVYDLLVQEKFCWLQGSALNLDDNQHLRVVFLPRVDVLDEAIGKFARFLDKYTK